MTQNDIVNYVFLYDNESHQISICYEGWIPLGCIAMYNKIIEELKKQTGIVSDLSEYRKIVVEYEYKGHYYRFERF